MKSRPVATKSSLNGSHPRKFRNLWKEGEDRPPPLTRAGRSGRVSAWGQGLEDVWGRLTRAATTTRCHCFLALQNALRRVAPAFQTRARGLGASPMCETTELAEDGARIGTVSHVTPARAPGTAHTWRGDPGGRRSGWWLRGKGRRGCWSTNTATRPRSPLSPGSRSTVPRWPNTPADKGFRGDP